MLNQTENREQLIRAEFINFMQIVYTVIDQSYAIEWTRSSNEWLDDKGPIVLERGALFLRVKDAYEDLKFAKQQVNSFLKMLPECQAHGIKTVPQFIDKIVGGNDGQGYCLQSATYSLMTFYNHIVDNTEQITEKFNKTRYSYKRMENDEGSIQHLNPTLNFVESSGNRNQILDLENSNLFFREPPRTFKRLPIEALMEYKRCIERENNLIELSAINKMICLLKNVPPDTAITSSENLALNSGRLGKIISKFPECRALLDSNNEINYSPFANQDESRELSFRFSNTESNKRSNDSLFSNMAKWMPMEYKTTTSYLLSEAINQNDLEKIRSLLMQHNVREFEQPIPEGNYVPPLHVAVEEGKLHIVQILLATGFNMNILSHNNGSRSPLSLAAEHGHSELIRLLIARGANLDLVDNFGKKPLEWSEFNQPLSNKIVADRGEADSNIENDDQSRIDSSSIV